MKERDTKILPIRIKNTLFELVEERVTKKKVSRNSWVIWAIKQGLRRHVRKEDVNQS